MFSVSYRMYTHMALWYSIPSKAQKGFLFFILPKNKTNCAKICLGGLIGLRTLNVRLETEKWLKMVLPAPWTRGHPSQRSSHQEWPLQRQSHLQQGSVDTCHLQILILIWSNSHICNMIICFVVQWPSEPCPWLSIVLSDLASPQGSTKCTSNQHSY